jgi:hypothetical protein
VTSDALRARMIRAGLLRPADDDEPTLGPPLPRPTLPLDDRGRAAAAVRVERGRRGLVDVNYDGELRRDRERPR